MWLETCEIQDVKISSGSLFKNLQTEFREKSRMEAERIEAETQSTIDKERLIRNNTMEKQRLEESTKTQMYRDEQSLLAEKNNADTYQKRQLVDQQKE